MSAAHVLRSDVSVAGDGDPPGSPLKVLPRGTRYDELPESERDQLSPDHFGTPVDPDNLGAGFRPATLRDWRPDAQAEYDAEVKAAFEDFDRTRGERQAEKEAAAKAARIAAIEAGEA